MEPKRGSCRKRHSTTADAALHIAKDSPAQIGHRSPLHYAPSHAFSTSGRHDDRGLMSLRRRGPDNGRRRPVRAWQTSRRQCRRRIMPAQYERLSLAGRRRGTLRGFRVYAPRRCSTRTVMISDIPAGR